MIRAIVLGRFQPFHNGHASLVMKAADVHPNTKVMVAIGSAQSEWEPNNPWSAKERTMMINAWATHHNIEIEICTIEDINDPPNWVSHATKFHGVGVLVTSDEDTHNLYQQSGFETSLIDLSNRDNFEGWRVRQTALMLSTVYDDDAVASVLGASVPEVVVKWLIDNDAIYRLSTMGSGVNVG